MTSFVLFLLLVAGGAGYVSWAKHAVAQGAHAWWFVAAAPIAYLAPVVLIVAISFALSWVWRSPRPAGAHLDLRGCVRLFLGEVRAVAASWLLIAFHRFVIRDPPRAPVAHPVLLVHGVLVNDGVWFTMRRRLARAGVAGVYTANYGPPYESIDHFAQQLRARIDAVCSATGAARVTLLCHSMGGLVARTCLRDTGPARIERIITLGTPHHGSVLAWMYFGRCLAQMRPGNAWLAKLNRDEGDVPPVPLVSIWSRHDNLVVPQTSGELGGVENVPVLGVGHNALLEDRRVAELALGRITSGVVTPSVDLSR